MSNYNNKYSRLSGSGETPMRFNKRPRYVGNNSPRFSQTNQTSYNYQQNRNNLPPPPGYQHNSYESSPRNFYGYSSNKQPSQRQQYTNFERPKNQSSSPFSNVSRRNSSSTSTPSPAKKKSNTPQSATTAQSNHQQQSTTNVPENIPDQTFAHSNYFYPNYKTDATESPTTSSYGMNYNISQYMWQTITSTPPPLILHQPPLPQNSPPTQLPPLPDGDIPPSIQPPPSAFPDRWDNRSGSGNLSVSKPVVKIKVKRKSMSARYGLSKNWNQEDAELALKAENECTNWLNKDAILVLRFPDPEINREIVKCYHPAIKSVHFQLNFAPRYCFVRLQPGTDVQQAIEILSKIPFGNGFLKAELKNLNNEPRQTQPCNIDPYTLYVGNLPTTIACAVLKEHFPGALRIDIGFAQRMKYTRYAFIRYPNVQLAIEACKRMSNAEIGGRSVLLRFRRNPAERNDQKDDAEYHEDMPADDDSIEDFRLQNDNEDSIPLSQNQADIADEHQESRNPIDIEAQTVSQKSNYNASKNSSNLNTDIDNNVRDNCITNNDPHNSETDPESNKETMNEQNEVETMANNSNINSENHEVSLDPSKTIQDDRNSSITPQNIKPDPDIDPADRVVEDETIKSRFDHYDQRVKQEREMVSDFEFFAPANDQLTGNRRNTIMNESISLSTATTDDCDETIDTGNSLSEFLRTCQKENPSNDDDVATARKRTKTLLDKEIKNEPVAQSIANINNDLVHTTAPELPIETTAFKHELNATNENLNNKSVDDICNLDILPEDNFLQSILVEKTKAVPSRIEAPSSNPISNLKRKNPNASKDGLTSSKNLLAEKEKHLNKYNTKEVSNQTAKKRKSAAHFQTENSSTDNDDLVPPSALFFRSDSTDSVRLITNELYEDEFFSTQSQKLNKINSTSLVEVKQEAIEQNTLSSQQEQPTNRQNQERRISKSAKNNLMPANFSNDLNKQLTGSNEDDSVPENNCLLSRQLPSQIKLEKDLDDLFTIPFKKTYHEQLSDKYTDNDIANASGNNDDNFMSVSAIQYDELSDEDDDLIIISENFPQISNATIRTSSAEGNFLGQYDLLTIKRITATTDHNLKKPLYGTILESSRKLHHDNLDKLFQQLDSDSDSEL